MWPYENLHAISAVVSAAQRQWNRPTQDWVVGGKNVITTILINEPKIYIPPSVLAVSD